MVYVGNRKKKKKKKKERNNNNNVSVIYERTICDWYNTIDKKVKSYFALWHYAIDMTEKKRSYKNFFVTPKCSLFESMRTNLLNYFLKLLSFGMFLRLACRQFWRPVFLLHFGATKATSLKSNITTKGLFLRKFYILWDNVEIPRLQFNSKCCKKSLKCNKKLNIRIIRRCVF